MQIGDIIPIHFNPYLLNCFDGWAIILDTPEPQETFLVDNSMYQVYRVKVKFLLFNELNGLRPGKYNDPFAKEFITHRKIRILLQHDVNDADIRSLTYTPTKNGKEENQRECTDR